jgi:peptide/nickel transport system substrate-binding protein
MTTRSRFRSFVTAGVAALVLLGATACAGGGVAGSGGGGSTLRVAAGALGPFTNQFNPFLQASLSASGYSTSAIYEPLMMPDYLTASAKPWLATGFTWAAEGKELTIDLRPGVKWSDGKPMTADDVAFTFELMKSQKALNFNGLPVASATVASTNQVKVTFTEPAYQTLWWLTMPVPKAQWSGVKDPVTYTNPKPVGTGPFKLKTFSAQVVTLEKNPSYWDAGKPGFNTVQYLAYDSDSSMVAAMQGGQVDWIVSSNTDPQLIAKGSPSTIGSLVTPFGVSIYLLPNAGTPPTNDPALRKAISQAVDRPALAKLAFGPGAQAIDSPTGLSDDRQADLIATQYKDLRNGGANPTEARSTLEAAGYHKGSDGYYTTPDGKSLTLSLTVPTTNPYGDWVRAGTLIADQLNAAGIKLTLKSASQQSWRSDVSMGKFQLALRAAGGAPSLFDNFDRLIAQNGKANGKDTKVNWERYTNPNAAALLNDLAATEVGTPEYRQALAGVQQLMVEDTPVIPLASPASAGVWRKDLFSGWPSDNDLYALPTANKPSVLQVLTAIKPTAK